MHQRCMRNVYEMYAKRCTPKMYTKVTKENVRVIVKVIDWDGVELRQKQPLWRGKFFSGGPNWALHIDGYDKLKPYGFPINGWIDGYSQSILWLSIVFRITTLIEIVMKLYLDCNIRRKYSKKSSRP